MSMKYGVRDWIAGANLPAITPHVLDQGLHVLWGFGMCYIAGRAGMRGMWTHILLPVLVFLPREIVDQYPFTNHIGDSLIDLSFFALGGLIAWMIGEHRVR